MNKLSQSRDNYTYHIQEHLADITDPYISTNFDGVVLPSPHLKDAFINNDDANVPDTRLFKCNPW